MRTRAELQRREHSNQRTQSSTSHSQSRTRGRRRNPLTAHYRGNSYQRAQAKLRLGISNDFYEQEADKVAEKLVSGKTSKRITPLSDNSGGVNVSSEVSNKLQSESGKGSPLPDTLKSKFESGLNTDLSDVRVHTDSTANDLSQSLQAKALTYGKDIYFNEGEYKPGTEEGDKLLAHEVTHTVQQTGSKEVQRNPIIDAASQSLEPGGFWSEFVKRAIGLGVPGNGSNLDDAFNKIFDDTVSVAVTAVKIVSNPVGTARDAAAEAITQKLFSQEDSEKLKADKAKSMNRFLNVIRAKGMLELALRDIVKFAGSLVGKNIFEENIESIWKKTTNILPNFGADVTNKGINEGAKGLFSKGIKDLYDSDRIAEANLTSTENDFLYIYLFIDKEQYIENGGNLPEEKPPTKVEQEVIDQKVEQNFKGIKEELERIKT